MPIAQLAQVYLFTECSQSVLSLYLLDSTLFPRRLLPVPRLYRKCGMVSEYDVYIMLFSCYIE